MPARQLIISLLCLSLAACSAGPPAAVTAEPFCRVGGMAFHTGFEAAALHGCAPGESGPVLTIAPEYAPVNPSPWYAWRIVPEPDSGAGSGAVTVTQRYLHGWHRYPPWVSADGEDWRRLPDSQVSVAQDGTATLRLEVPAGGLFVAAQPPLTSTAMYQWAKGLAADNGLRRITATRSVQGRPVTAYQSELAGRPGSLILVGRQHPPEVTGGLAFRDFVERLFSDEDLARRFRDRFAIGLVPEINPDGVARGHWRTNARGVDLNRDWGPFTQPETRGVAAWLDGLNEQAPVMVFIDFHSTNRDMFYMPHAGDDPIPAGFSAAWRARLRERLGDAMPDWSGEHNPGLPTAKSWVRNEYGVLAMTYEVGDNTPRDRIRRIARAAAEETMKLLLESREVGR
jgi:predicted deacylase